MRAHVVFLTACGCLSLPLVSCARAGYAPRFAPRSLGMCAFLPHDQESHLVARLRSIGSGAQSLDAKASALRSALPNAQRFSDFHSDLCLPAATGDLSSKVYYYLLDTIAPIAVDRQVTTLYVEELNRAPALETPADSTVFDTYPRSTRVRWDAVGGAVNYLVEVEVFLSQPNEFRPSLGETGHITAATEDSFDFVGAQWGRWRVRALDTWGRAGPPSAWRYFKYLR